MSDNKPPLELLKALHAVQSELPIVERNAENTYHGSKYADLAALTRAARPVLVKHGLVVTQLLGERDGVPALATALYHVETGQELCSTIKMTLGKQTAQELGSWITYARRYAFAALIGAVAEGEDDDGNATLPGKDKGRGNGKPRQEQPTAPPPPPPETPDQKAERIRNGAENATAEQVDKCKTWLTNNGSSVSPDVFDGALAALTKRQRQLAATVT